MPLYYSTLMFGGPFVIQLKVAAMPKMKTNKSISKRVKVTGTGKMLRHKPAAGHLKSTKSPKRIRRFRKSTSVSDGFAKQARRGLGLE